MNVFSFTDAPLLKLEVPDQVQEGHSVQFKCILLGAMPSALSLVTWKKDGVDIESLYQSRPLEIRSVAVSDAGVYTCSRSNSVGVGESPPVTFHVNCKYYIVGLSLNPATGRPCIPVFLVAGTVPAFTVLCLRFDAET